MSRKYRGIGNTGGGRGTVTHGNSSKNRNESTRNHGNWYDTNVKTGVYDGDNKPAKLVSQLDVHTELLEIDGSVLEGGGQVLRISTALSCILKRPIRVSRIRAGRSKPGLAAQHLTGLELLALLTNGEVVGAEKGSQEIELAPSKLEPPQCVYGVVGTAGSIGLLLQSIVPVLLFSEGSYDKVIETSIRLVGGTDVDFAPTLDFYLNVFKVYLTRMLGSRDHTVISPVLNRRGYFPAGGGAVTLDIYRNNGASVIPGFTFVEHGNLRQIGVSVYVSQGVFESRAKQCYNTALETVRTEFPRIEIKEEFNVISDKSQCFRDGYNILVTALTDTGYILAQNAVGGKRTDPEAMARDAVIRLQDDVRAEACVDSQMQDQLIIFMFLAIGSSKIKTGSLTMHTKTAIHICNLFDDEVKFEIREVTCSEKDSTPRQNSKPKSFIIECSGRQGFYRGDG